MGRPPSDLDDYLDWQERLESYRASGLDVDAFCLQEGVSRSTFYRWVGRLKNGVPESMVAEKAARERAESGEAAFVPIRGSAASKADSRWYCRARPGQGSDRQQVWRSSTTVSPGRHSHALWHIHFTKHAVPLGEGHGRTSLAVTYARNRWAALRGYTEDGRLTIDNNLSERTLRHQAIGCKNWLFLGSEAAGPRAAVLYTILASARRHRSEPWAYVRDLLLRFNAGDPHLEEMSPDRWAAAHPEAILSHRLDESRAKAARTRQRRAYRRTHSR